MSAETHTTCLYVRSWRFSAHAKLCNTNAVIGRKVLKGCAGMVKFRRLTFCLGLLLALAACKNTEPVTTKMVTENPTVTTAPTVTPIPKTTTPTFVKSVPTLTTPPYPAIILTVTPLYRHYVPKDNSLFRFEFQYPSRWVIDKSNAVATIEDIWLTQPGIKGAEILLNGRRGSIEDIIATILAAPEFGDTILEDKVIRIDGYEARYILINRPNGNYLDYYEDQPYIELDIFLNISDRSYWFRLITLVGDENSQFAQDFKTMVMGMKYIP